MAKRSGYGLLFAMVGLVVAAEAGYFLILWFSSNIHVRSVEASITGIFVCGPVGAVLGFVAGFTFGGRRLAKPNEHAEVAFHDASAAKSGEQHERPACGKTSVRQSLMAEWRPM
jgi:hypothetical protein